MHRFLRAGIYILIVILFGFSIHFLGNGLYELDSRVDLYLNFIDEARKLEKIVGEQMKQKDSSNWDTNLSIPVLVFVCNRAEALRAHINKLLKFRPSFSSHPIIVSQDCSSLEVSNVIREFGEKISHIQHDIETPSLDHKEARYAVYYRISQHYKLGLEYVFDIKNYSSVIVTEDDLDISPDFFSYFDRLNWILDADKSVFCISAWNDNGKDHLIDTNAAALAYRTDFFPGLGWMINKEFWHELRKKWPKGFWDDWIREPEQRKNRSCIRPEISRTSMTRFGKSGASRGMFFNKHLKRIVILNNTLPLLFAFDLSYLLKENYDAQFLDLVYSLPLFSVDKLSAHVKIQTDNKAVRIEYDSMLEFSQIAKVFGIMADSKAGVPRTAYQGIVTCYFKGIRVFIAPNQTNWNGYDRNWQISAEV